MMQRQNKNSRNPKVHGSGCFDFVILQSCNDRIGKFLGRGVPAHILCEHFTCRNNGGDGTRDACSCLSFAQMRQHERCGKDCCRGVDFVLSRNIRCGTVYRLKDCSGFTDIRTGRQPKPALPYSGRAAADQPPVLLTARWIPKQFALRTRPEVCRQRLCQWKRFLSRTLPRHERGFLPVWAVRFSKQSFTGIFFVCPYCHFAGRGV